MQRINNFCAYVSQYKYSLFYLILKPRQRLVLHKSFESNTTLNNNKKYNQQAAYSHLFLNYKLNSNFSKSPLQSIKIHSLVRYYNRLSLHTFLIKAKREYEILQCFVSRLHFFVSKLIARECSSMVHRRKRRRKTIGLKPA